MKISLFRLPPRVVCSRSNKEIRVSGPTGLVMLRLATDFVQKGSVIRFARPLSSLKRAVFNQAVLGVSLSYGTELRLQGIGYRVHKQEGQLFFKLGYSHPVIVDIPKVVEAECVKNGIHLRSAHLSTLHHFTTKLRCLRSPDCYKGSGIVYRGERVFKKEGKKT